jgi:hypothetical protein
LRSTPEVCSWGKTPKKPTSFSGVGKRSSETILATRAAAVSGPMPGIVSICRCPDAGSA